MTGIRRPNRRRVPALLEAAIGEVCLATRKIRYLDERTAAIAARELSSAHPAQGAATAYRCTRCGDWHVGHRTP